MSVLEGPDWRDAQRNGTKTSWRVFWGVKLWNLTDSRPLVLTVKGGGVGLLQKLNHLTRAYKRPGIAVDWLVTSDQCRQSHHLPWKWLRHQDIKRWSESSDIRRKAVQDTSAWHWRTSISKYAISLSINNCLRPSCWLVFWRNSVSSWFTNNVTSSWYTFHIFLINITGLLQLTYIYCNVGFTFLTSVIKPQNSLSYSCKNLGTKQDTQKIAGLFFRFKW